MRRRRSSWLSLVAVALLGCSSGTSTSPPGGTGGAGGSTGAGGAPLDAGPDSSSLDASTDAQLDAGPEEPDASDAGPLDDGGDGGDAAPPPLGSAPGVPCADSLADVYVTPPGLPAMTLATRGDLVRCAVDSVISKADVGSQVLAKGITTSMASGVSLYRLAFRTNRGDGSAGVSTARVYLPQKPLASPLPVVVIGHPTVGLAQSCTPSLDPTSNQDLALPWAGLGYAVIVPDYAGLGNGGAQSYLDNRDQGQALLDGARALRKLLPQGALSTSVFMAGYSQGGGAVLSAQALAKGYGADGDLTGLVVFAPEWPTRLNSFGYVDMLNNPDGSTLFTTGLSENVVAVMRAYAYFYNKLGATHAGDSFPAVNRDGIDDSVATLCQTPLGGYLQVNEPIVGDIFDPTFRTTLLACINGGPTGAGCADPGLGYYTYLQQNFVTADPNGPPILFVQGLADLIMPAASEAACNLDKLKADGVTPQVCVDFIADHETVVGRNMDFALSWGTALLNGQTRPACSSAGLPSCTP